MKYDGPRMLGPGFLHLKVSSSFAVLLMLPANWAKPVNPGVSIKDSDIMMMYQVGTKSFDAKSMVHKSMQPASRDVSTRSMGHAASPDLPEEEPQRPKRRVSFDKKHIEKSMVRPCLSHSLYLSLCVSVFVVVGRRGQPPRNKAGRRPLPDHHSHADDLTLLSLPEPNLTNPAFLLTAQVKGTGEILNRMSQSFVMDRSARQTSAWDKTSDRSHLDRKSGSHLEQVGKLDADLSYRSQLIQACMPIDP